jgi:hypothetical protein
MNHKVVLKLSSDNVLNLLKDKVTDSNGTIQFLTMLRLLNEAFAESNVPVEKRVYNAFYCLIFFRIWKYHCHVSSDMKMDSFVSNESYLAMELNAWNLLKLVIICRVIGAKFFQPQLAMSQTCEKCFSIVRTFTSTFSTVVNFSSLELIERLHKVQLQEEIINILKDDFVFRQNLVRLAKYRNAILEEMPNDLELERLINQAKSDALNSAKSLGIVIQGKEEFAVNFFSCVKDYLKIDSQPTLENLKMNQVGESASKFFEFQGIKFVNESTGNDKY